MDPNETLAEALRLAAKIAKDYADLDGNGPSQEDANRLAELLLALDGWLTEKQGFFPFRWDRRNS